jgi:hypothetical protein
MFIFAGGALFSGLDWLVYTVVIRRRAYIDAALANDLARIQAYRDHAAIIRGMTAEQLEAYGRQRVEIETVPGSGTSPQYTLVMPYCRVPWDFVETFLRQGDGTYLPPIRHWGEGSKPREYAEALSRYFVEGGYAAGAEGNHSAYWISSKKKLEGLASIGYEENL